MEKLFILKIGGSVATDKESSDYTIQKKLLTDIFTELSKVLKNDKSRLIVIHGAGGHIHHLAHIHGLKTGSGTNPQKKAGALETQQAVTRLHEDIMNIATDCGLLMTSIPTHTVVTQNKNCIDSCNTRGIQEALAGNHVPMLCGDMVDDHTLGMSICSGDTLIAHLSTLFPVTHAFFATDVDGIYTADPYTDTTATLIEKLTFSEIDTQVTLGSSHNTDTTGGLYGKIQECKNLFDTSTHLQEIHIFNGLKKINYTCVLQGKNFPHTCITS